MRNFAFIAILTLALSLFYTAVGNVLPQLESRPPAEVKLGNQEMSSDDLVQAGSGVFDANCMQCHRLGKTERCPDLAGMGARAAERAKARTAATGKPYTELDYLVESLCQPGAHLVEGFGNIMPPQGKVLTGGQVLAVTAFLEDQGGAVTASIRDAAGSGQLLERFGCGGAGGSAGPAVAAAAPVGAPDKVVSEFGCAGCHNFDKPDRLIGPSLQDVGKRLDNGQLFEALLAPDLTIPKATPEYPSGLMKATLDGNGFYDRMKPADYMALVEWLKAHGG